MGAAGLTSSASEMAGRSGSGVEFDVSNVPVRESGMTPYEILLSESQERMLVVAKSGHEPEVRQILEKWELGAEPIGCVTDDGQFRVLENGTVVADIPALPLTEGCPTYEHDVEEDHEIIALRSFDMTHILKRKGDFSTQFLDLLGSPNIASKAWIYEQYDTTVRTNTVMGPGGDAGVIRFRGSRRGLAATMDCNGRYCYLDPRQGAKAAVAEAARNLVCVGAVPTAVTNCLNFGNPLKPSNYFQLREAVLGMAEACAYFETPVTGGNVSLYNETGGQVVYPTPVIGMVGILEDVSRALGHSFTQEGDLILLLGENREEIGGSEYLYGNEGIVAGSPPLVDLAAERQLQRATLSLHEEGVLHSAHDCAEGGLACALAESALSGPNGPWGVEVELNEPLAPAALLFGETQGRVLVSCDRGDAARVLEVAEKYQVPTSVIGSVQARSDTFSIVLPLGFIRVRSGEMARRYREAIPAIMEAGQP